MIQESKTQVLFPEMSEASRIWIYQSNRSFNEEERLLIQERAEAFTAMWESHGSKLKAEFELLYNTFLIFSVDEGVHEASGCSIDKSVHFIKDLQNGLKVDFFDRSQIAYLDSNNTIRYVLLTNLKNAINSEEINNNTLIFNNLADNLHKLRTDWIVPAGSSWLRRFF